MVRKDLDGKGLNIPFYNQNTMWQHSKRIMKIRCTLLKTTLGFKHHINSVLFSACLATAGLLLSSCQRVDVYHGHFIKDCDIQTLCVGNTTKAQVIQKLGTPTTILSYDPHTLYYLSHVVYTKPVLATKPVSCKCFALTFSKSGVLLNVFTSTKINPVVFSKESTPLPSGHQEGFWQQVVRSLEQSPPTTTISPA